MEAFNIPVVLLIFKRKDALMRILDIVSQVKPMKIYLVSDNGRNDEERRIVSECRASVERRIDWSCEVIKYYADDNRGVYNNIGGGAKWVFEREERAIFLEDDNLPAVSFFEYCRELLELYEENEKVLWICGTNYLEQYTASDGSSYMFSKQLLPCGWASWSHKFLKYYEGELNTLSDKAMGKIKEQYVNMELYKQQKDNFLRERYRIKSGKGPRSWDYQMLYSMLVNSMYGISPCYNLIRNIGADNVSEHGGTSLKMTMTNRFCEIATHEMEFPLRHPKEVAIDVAYEKRISRIILLPLSLRIGKRIRKVAVKIFHLDYDYSFVEAIRRHKKRRY